MCHRREFPSPQGGSETATQTASARERERFHPLKAGRRPVYLRGYYAACLTRFHPLKAGRRLTRLKGREVGVLSFHPLKAGRRHHPVTFPSTCKASFHPLKAGRRPFSRPCSGGERRMFPSPQGGSETVENQRTTDHASTVSIPSRRVGDLSPKLSNEPTLLRFHPLKAGRRQLVVVRDLGFVYGFHPLKAGRRLHLCR